MYFSTLDYCHPDSPDYDPRMANHFDDEDEEVDNYLEDWHRPEEDE